MTNHTADQLEQSIHNALEAHDVRAAVDILEALAAVDLARATKIYDQIQRAIVVADFLHGGSP